jgi:hypothetical protein
MLHTPQILIYIDIKYIVLKFKPYLSKLNDFIYCGRRSMSVIYYFLTTMDDNFETKGVRRNVDYTK